MRGVEVQRLEVEEGFLDGIDLRFVPGLNVLIGPRGAGKTSVIELLRFCLGVAGTTAKTDAASRQHVLSILGSGRATLTLAVNGETVILTRTAGDARPSRSGSGLFEQPMVFSQNEIETIGVDAVGRLRLLDGFLPETAPPADERSLASLISSITLDIRSRSAEIQELRNRIEELGSAPKELAAAESEQRSALESVDAARGDQEKLDALARLQAGASVRASILERTSAAIAAWRDRLEQSRRAEPQLEKWPAAAESEDQLASIRGLLGDSSEHLKQAIAAAAQALAALETLAQQSRDEDIRAGDEARFYRRRLETLKEGAGGVAKRVADLRERAAHLATSRELLESKSAELTRLQTQRTVMLDELDALRSERYGARSEAADQINQELGPRIRVEVGRYGLHQEYANSIAEALRGSGLHYNTLAPLLAGRMSPREFVEAIERNDAALISELADIGLDRATRLITFIRESGVAPILAAPVEDSVELSLLDGAEYKRTESASTGQRCTVVLPLLLARKEQTLIVDQPEDHLDNAFIVETVVEAIGARRPRGQTIFSTHNPNLPVLGEADLVVLLGSDGKRGFVRHAGALDNPQSIEAITTVMEGGREAFERRARFYQKTSALVHE